ncbi:hypothetical protein EXIGLDRAFT_760742 [Exidia glandulosa HHB12029]|uniref:U6 snRNA phosphodiesterase 1 n=1 Tax=Exidia glandulosa HHB12029 TaxID=1314781 RepID=A0A165P220_EXIGL|nr:hypothetical protein EXIGLDRAFT_760742 [Exidia glandulosa HHB12029]
MKRSLVAYASSDDEDPTPPKKPRVDQPRKKLPGLPSSIYAHVDDPAMHQGRVRTSRHVEGLYPAYVHIVISLADVPELADVVTDATRFARGELPALRSTCASEADIQTEVDQGAAELHISLSRPVFISANQRDSLRAAARRIAAKHRPFRASFSTFSVLTNDERTRTFLALDVGAGFQQLNDIVQDVNSALRAMHQDTYYDDPRFHASIAWAVLHTASALSSESSVPEFPPYLLQRISDKFMPELGKLSPFDVGRLNLRIGKTTDSWDLGVPSSR